MSGHSRSCGCAAKASPAPSRGGRALRSKADLDQALAALQLRQRRVLNRIPGGRSLLTKSQQAEDPPWNEPDCLFYFDEALSYKCDTRDSGDACTTAWTTQTYNDADFTVRSDSHLTSTEQADLEQIVKRAMAHWNIPSFALSVLSPMQDDGSGGMIAPRLVYQAGLTWHPGFKAHGFADENPALTGLHMARPITRFRIASLSKVLTALGIMRLARLYPADFSLDAPITSFGFIKSVTGLTITARHLLCHASGLPEDPASDAEVGHHLQRLPVSRDETIDYMADLEHGYYLKSKPNTVTAYSNYGYMVLGRLIEEVSGVSYTTWIRRHVLNPCGMTSTEPADSLASGSLEVNYYANRISCGCSCNTDCKGSGIIWTPDDLYTAKSAMDSLLNSSENVLDGRDCVRAPYGGVNLDRMLPAYGWKSNVRDLARLMRAFHLALEGENFGFLSKSAAEEMVTDQTPDTGKHGLGWAVDNFVFGHQGRICGTTSGVWSTRTQASLGTYHPSVSWIANADMSRKCREAFESAMTSLVKAFSYTGTGDLL